MTEQTHELFIDLVLDAPREKLFRCYTDPNLLQQWFAPKPWTIKSVDIDPRAGGRFNFVMASPEGQEFPNSRHLPRGRAEQEARHHRCDHAGRLNPPVRSWSRR